MALDKITTGIIADDAVTGTQIAPNAIEITDVAANVIPVKPHIQPGVLQPAVAGKDLSGTALGGSYTYGTAHTDGHSYYYTDIKGSKPIKDPRIGAHFGSQRHKFKSLQLLEQETATHGNDVFSFDGREWIRGVGGWTNWIDGASSGGAISSTQNDFFEITGYFSNANYIAFTDTNDRSIRVTIDGGTEDTTVYGGAIGAANPLSSRYVDAGNLHQIATTTLGIHTIKIRKQGTASTTAVNGIELIAQDTGSTVRKNHVNIPAQNVVSYGKKFSIGSDTLTNAVHKHYNPFAFKTDGSTAWASGAHNGTSWPVGTGSSHNIDTATSLGLENWKHSNNYYKPYNGGRVVKWVDSSGTIKTSVNMMPPNARSIGNSASLTNATAKANASIANNTFYPTMEAGAIDHSLAEVAKTFSFREFGNGSANGNASYKDLSTVVPSTINQSVAYVMDDGLTSSAGVLRDGTCSTAFGCIYPDNTGDFWYTTFIGTGFSIHGTTGIDNHIQNLPYGTHIIKYYRDGTTANSQWTVDGVNYHQAWGNHQSQITFHQPKMPPIPEDAVIVGDFMLMADFVALTADSIGAVSKGVRLQSISRDVFIDSSNGAWNFNHAEVTYQQGMRVYLNTGAGSNTSSKFRLPSFATNFSHRGFNSTARSNLYIDDTEETGVTAVGSGEGSSQHLTNDKILGVYNLGSNVVSGENGITSGFEIATPIHTSSHYQPFETPFLKELVGGDRNMEQTNLVVTTDGKSWDEVTRNTSYLGNTNISTTIDVNETSDDAIMKFDEWRGQLGTVKSWHYNKDFAIAYDRVICLVDGHYEIHVQTISAGAGTNGRHGSIKINGVLTLSGHTGQSNLTSSVSDLNIFLKRGDYVQVTGKWYGGSGGHFDNFQIKRIN